MTPEQQKKIDDLHTALLGIPGTADKGFIGEVKDMLKEHDTRLDEHDAYIEQQKGAGRVVHYLQTLGISIAAIVADHFTFRSK